ncbi:MAG: ATP phosphoribosyltransferase regulatory subunit [Planctomycetales bacterium]|nr:ATP phosphoribosyltransferase regulatory subunit [Planctomycetales bacterium]
MNFQPLGGTRDLAGQDKEELDWIRRTIMRRFRSYGYALVEPPVLQATGPFLERSGEEIRQRMYSFTDSNGVEVCLRPEMTIPTCRLFLNHAEQFQSTGRVCYDGIVLRFNPVEYGRLREFRQVGVEHFGHSDAVAADAEALGLAMDAIGACGIDRVSIVMNDIRFVAAILDDLEVEPVLRDRIWQRLHSKQPIAEVLRHESGAEEVSRQEVGGANANLGHLLQQVGPEMLQTFVVDILALTHGAATVGRGADEIAERMVAKIQRSASQRLTPELSEALGEVLSLRGQPRSTLDSLREVATRRKFHRLEPLISDFQRRLDLIEGCGIALDDVTLDLGLRRSLQYYTGFVFEIHEPTLEKASEICGGGRYDQLLKSMGAPDVVPTVGFAIGADRMKLAVEKRGQPPASATTDVLVAPTSAEAVGGCFAVAAAMRRAGWTAETVLSGDSAEQTLARAKRLGVATVALIGAATPVTAQLHRLRDGRQQSVGLDELESYVAQQRGDAR